MPNPFRKRPWLWVVVAFIVLISAWVTLITIAVRFGPERVPLKEPAADVAGKPED